MRTIVVLGRVATMFVVSAGLFSGIILFGIGCAAVPVGIVWDIASWAISGHWAMVGATQRIMQSHFIWGAAVGAGIAKLWHESEDWAVIARTPILGSLFGHVTASADHRESRPD